MNGKTNLALNLTTLCRDYPSISFICRKLEINRQQFNKYLSGSVQPSPFNLVRICRFFDLREEQIHAAPDEFARSRLAGKPAAAPPPDEKPADSFMEFPADAGGQLDRYLGYYFTYYRSPSFPKSLFRSIVYLYKKDNFVYSKGLERYINIESAKGLAPIGKEHGKVSYTDDRIYIAERVSHIRKSFSLTALYPTYRARLDLLSGVFVSVSSGAGRQPFTSRVVFEYMGARPNLRSMIALAGIYPQDAPAIREEIRAKCRNTLDDDILRAIDY